MRIVVAATGWFAATFLLWAIPAAAQSPPSLPSGLSAPPPREGLPRAQLPQRRKDIIVTITMPDGFRSPRHICGSLNNKMSPPCPLALPRPQAVRPNAATSAIKK